MKNNLHVTVISVKEKQLLSDHMRAYRFRGSLTQTLGDLDTDARKHRDGIRSVNDELFGPRCHEARSLLRGENKAGQSSVVECRR